MADIDTGKSSGNKATKHLGCRGLKPHFRFLSCVLFLKLTEYEASDSFAVSAHQNGWVLRSLDFLSFERMQLTTFISDQSVRTVKGLSEHWELFVGLPIVILEGPRQLDHESLDALKAHTHVG